jgi:hypothetical protein
MGDLANGLLSNIAGGAIIVGIAIAGAVYGVMTVFYP